MKQQEAILILPTQLFEKHDLLDKNKPIFLIEHPRYFTEFRFHKQKMLFHRATMQMYKDHLKEKGFEVTYIPFYEIDRFYSICKEKNISIIHCYDPVDKPLQEDLSHSFTKSRISLQLHETPLFLSPTEWIHKLFAGKQKYRMQNFYTAQRKRLNILMTKDGKPVGGAWSFDKENRKPLPKNIAIPKIYRPKENNYTKEAKKYVEEHFADNPGNITTIYYPATFDTAKKAFDDFLKNRFSLFGPYEDAIDSSEPFLFHSILSPLLNIGLLTPDYIVQKTLDYAKEHKTHINSVEGFIRQIIGWREYVRAVYILKGKELRSSNFFDHKKSLPRSFWTASTGIEPIDESIKPILESAYAHHIIRLMILGNFMLLCEINPHDSYQWFMELFIDAYDWVMVPNLYGMSQYAAADLMTTKPYISGSNYILKMSNFKKGGWCDTWNALYWHFIFKKQKKLSDTREFSAMIMMLKRIKEEKLKEYLNRATTFLKKLSMPR